MNESRRGASYKGYSQLQNMPWYSKLLTIFIIVLTLVIGVMILLFSAFVSFIGIVLFYTIGLIRRLGAKFTYPQGRATQSASSFSARDMADQPKAPLLDAEKTKGQWQVHLNANKR